jgi:hypothetical protein
MTGVPSLLALAAPNAWGLSGSDGRGRMPAVPVVVTDVMTAAVVGVVWVQKDAPERRRRLLVPRVRIGREPASGVSIAFLPPAYHHTPMLDWPERWRVRLLAAVALASGVAQFLLMRPTPQSQAYHQFADRRSAVGIPNFGDVASNALFLAVGLYGLTLVARRRQPAATAPNPGDRPTAAYAAFFAGVALTCFGSAYYHWLPTNARLVWDRLPMSVGFMGLLSATISERVSGRLGRALLAPLLGLGLGSVLLWAWTEARGGGDLRLYYGVQFLSLGLILLMALLFRPPHGGTPWLLASMGVYALAKASESNDRAIFEALGVSGHTLKHVLAAGGVLLIAQMLAARARRRGPQPAPLHPLPAATSP